MKTDDLDFHLPPELIAQEPARDRPASRLLHYSSADRSITHRHFVDLPDLLRPTDLLVFNNARVVPARFALIKPTGGRVEGLFLSQREPKRWSVLLKNVGPWTTETAYAFEDLSPSPAYARERDGVRASSRVDASGPHPNPLPEYRERRLGAHIVSKGDEGQFTLEVDTDDDAIAFLERIGRMPLPPYIRRDKQRDGRDEMDRDRYQTVYASASGSVAAPTAGLHFDQDVLSRIDAKGVERAFLTLHVGMGTFKPVTADDVRDHAMHVERYSVDGRCVEQLNRAKCDGRRIVAVGTTACRVLESQPDDRAFEPRDDETGIFIYPPYRWRHVGALITNFHLPRSTLIALVAARVGLDEQRRIYAEAIAERYRFFSYGDSSFLE
jgi:S-adenosylmethionine:tRNA ribosyltransferase-isomerase